MGDVTGRTCHLGYYVILSGWLAALVAAAPPSLHRIASHAPVLFPFLPSSLLYNKKHRRFLSPLLFSHDAAASEVAHALLLHSLVPVTPIRSLPATTTLSLLIPAATVFAEYRTDYL